MCDGCAYWHQGESEGVTYSDFGHADFKAPPERPAGSNGLCVSGAARLVVTVGVMTRKKQIESHHLWTLEQPSGSLL